MKDEQSLENLGEFSCIAELKEGRLVATQGKVNDARGFLGKS